MRVLVLGATGMLGSSVFRLLSENDSWEVFGTVRSPELKTLFPVEFRQRLVEGVDVNDHETLTKVFFQTVPDVVINCIALSKGAQNANDPRQAYLIYAVLPHKLAVLCSLSKARLVHISTDGVFSGERGSYAENDTPDAKDIYGVTKLMGEVSYPHTITIRTSIIGHELKTTNCLIDWFLSQEIQCKCFTRSIFSGLPTVVLARIIRDVVMPRADMFGVYHVAAEPISKFDLLQLVANVYKKSIELVPDDSVVIDRSLNADHFRVVTGYVVPKWEDLINAMYSNK